MAKTRIISDAILRFVKQMFWWKRTLMLPFSHLYTNNPVETSNSSEFSWAKVHWCLLYLLKWAITDYVQRWMTYMCVCVIVGQVSTVKWHFNTVNNNNKYAHTHTPTDTLAVSNTEHCLEERISCYYGWKDLHCICTAGIFQTKVCR